MLTTMRLRTVRQTGLLLNFMSLERSAVQLVERHVIRRADPRYFAIDQAAFASKNLYNAANYIVRQAFIHEGVYLGYAEVFHRIKDHEAYCALPRKISNDVLRQLDRNWRAFFQALAAWQANPAKFLGRPKLPGYKDKQQGRNILTYDIQALSAPGLRKGEVIPSQLDISIPTRQTTVRQARIVPRKGYYVVEVVYKRAPAPAFVNPALHAGVDLGVTNLAAITSDKPGFVPRIVNGRPVKSINQFYNKRKAELQRKLGHLGATARMERLTTHRTRQIDHYLHTASRRIIELLVAEGIGTLVLGKNPLWKREANLGRRANQNFVSIPHARFIDMLTYKAELVGIQVIVTEESYTSKASFLAGDPLPVYDAPRQEAPIFSGKRVKRGLYRTASGRYINADVNGAYNTLRKALPDAVGKGIAGAAVHPVRLTVRTKRAA
jgi:putative transposase